MEPEWNQDGTRMEPRWNQDGTKMEPKWNQNGTKMEPRQDDEGRSPAKAKRARSCRWEEACGRRAVPCLVPQPQSESEGRAAPSPAGRCERSREDDVSLTPPPHNSTTGSADRGTPASAQHEYHDAVRRSSRGLRRSTPSVFFPPSRPAPPGAAASVFETRRSTPSETRRSTPSVSS